jgi:thioredoxin reductase (NADPH)
VDKVKEKTNVEFVLNTNLLEIMGDQKVRSIKLDKPFNGSDTINVDGVFIEIGANPAVELATGIGCTLDAQGFLKVDEAMRTNVAGIFGAGDVTSASNHFAQFTTAAGEATVAANSAFNFLQSGH